MNPGWEDSAKASPDPDAARRLADAMSELSEEHWCAGWLIDCEFAIWGFLQNGPREWGFCVPDVPELEAIRSLSERAGGWIAWKEPHGETFVPAAEWAELYEKHCRELERRSAP